MRIAAVVPFLNETQLLPRFLRSLAAQTRTLDRLLLIDDGSSDDSHAIASEFAARHPGVLSLRRPPRPPRRDRLATADELHAFLWGVERVGEPWDVVAKLDADLELPPQTIAFLERRLEADPRLGMAGCYLTEVHPAGVRTRLRIRPEHVHGATKFYRRECFQDIAPLPAVLGWDTVDEVKARLSGWRTQSFAIPGGDPLHLRPRASYDGVARGYRRSGEGAYAVGEHPLHVVLFGLRHMIRAPGISGGVNYIAGWTMAAVRRFPRAEPEVRAHIRRDELDRIRRRLLGLVHPVRPVASS
jgi:biofilm PGA synthesis N-glycosyltransferase PgaC